LWIEEGFDAFYHRVLIEARLLPAGLNQSP
jgi:hypothetical protein